MIKALIAFVSLFIIFFVSIDLFRKMTRKEKWSVVKVTTYSALIAVLVMMILVGIVLVF
jgi:hypothetical protein